MYVSAIFTNIFLDRCRCVHMLNIYTHTYIYIHTHTMPCAPRVIDVGALFFFGGGAVAEYEL